MKDRPPSRGTLALIATAALWGSNHVVARAARDVVPLPALAFWRWLPAAAILTIIAWPAMRKAWPEVRARLSSLVVGGAIGVGLFSYLVAPTKAWRSKSDSSMRRRRSGCSCSGFGW